MKQLQEKFFFDLTNPQKSILMSEQFFGNPHIFIIPAWAYIKSDVDFAVLEQAINYTVKNHDAHRVRFIKTGDKTCQYFENYTPFDVEKMIIDDIEELEDYLKAVTFDIYGNTPIKFLMFENMSGHSGFACVLHHLIGDAWSLSLILEETLKAYDQLIQEGAITKLRNSSYKDFINSEENYLISEKFKKDKLYWQEKFSTNSEILSFKNNANIFNTASARKSLQIPQNLVTYCKENKISPFSFFFAAVSIYFSRITNSSEIIIGTPFLNRTNFAEKNSMGMFISTLPFKQNINSEQTVYEYIKEISIAQLGALRHQKYPYAELQKYYTAKFGRTNNLYDILFSYQNARADLKSLSFASESKWIYTNHQVESIVINISDIDSNNTLDIDYDYLTSVFTEKIILEMHERIMNIANQMMQNSNMLLKDIDIVTENEKHMLLNSFNNTSAPYNKKSTIATLVSDVANKTPNNIAVIFDNEMLTYKELDEKSNYLAEELIKNGITRNTYVGVLFNRSLEMIISILAVLKAGGAYVPINPDYPNDRIDFMLSDSDCKLLLKAEKLEYTNNSYKTIIVNNSKLKTSIIFDNINEPDDIAYAIYTSGSTGKPKGVIIKHSSIVNTLLWRKEAYKFDTNMCVLQIPSFAFDSSVEDIFTPLISGAKLVLIKQSNSNFDLPLIESLIKKYKTNHMLVVPSFYNVLLNEIPEELKHFKAITVAGEGFSIELVKKHFELLPEVELVNEYGPTENSVCTSYYKFNKNDERVYIGKPINNCKCYILNENLKLQPYNTKGELYVSGSGLAKGYIGRDDLTETRFIKNPFEEKSLMYKTGDVVSINENGLMTFHERTDYQVKYNGYRINLGEIESSISTYLKNPNVVVLLKRSALKSTLVAYIETKKEIDIADLKQNLKKFLPHYMLPKDFNLIAKFPSTPNGKVDRKALEKMEFMERNTVIVAPRNKLDSTILEAWKTVLKQENISIDDNIFEIGGDSLAIISIQSVLYKNNINVKSQVLFENPTIRSISDFLSSDKQKEIKNDIEISSPVKYGLDEINEKGNLPKNILLTGVTGFLGSHILAELLNKFDNITVYCLSRSKPNKSNEERLKEILHFYFGEKYDLLIGTRIIPIEGDLVREKLGIKVDLYKQLVSKIDTIINSASLVKHFGDYNLFYNSNVMSAIGVINFAREANASINHISTTSVSGNFLVKNDIIYDYTENDFYIGQNYKDNVYVRTKFEAENEMFKAMNEGLNVNIFRVGNLMQRASDGKFQINKFDNAYFKRIYGFIKMGKLPRNLSNQFLEFTPIDSCSEAIVKLISYKNKVFHLLNPNIITIKDLLPILNKYNLKIDFISEKEFTKFIQKDDNANYLQNFITDLNNSTKLNYDTSITINDLLTREYLRHNNFKWPMISKEYLDLFIKNILEDKTNEENSQNEESFKLDK